MGDQVVTLEHKADGVVAVGIPIAIFEVLCGLAVDDEVACGVLIKSANNVQKCCLTTARLAKDGNKLALAEVK